MCADSRPLIFYHRPQPKCLVVETAHQHIGPLLSPLQNAGLGGTQAAAATTQAPAAAAAMRALANAAATQAPAAASTNRRAIGTMQSQTKRAKSVRCAHPANVSTDVQGSAESELRAWEFMAYWGWECVKGSGLVDYFYVSPSLQNDKKVFPKQSWTKLGKHNTDYFKSRSEVLECVQSQSNELEIVEGRNTAQEFLKYKKDPVKYKQENME